ncbi:hypothetical protein LINPERHAP1_LOCUS36661 [Linum perenne]
MILKLISAVVAPPALQKLSEKFPGLHVYCDSSGLLFLDLEMQGIEVLRGMSFPRNAYVDGTRSSLIQVEGLERTGV